MRHDRYQMRGPPHADRNSDKGEENYSAPQRPLPANSGPHTCYYVPCACGLSTARTIRRTVFETAIPRNWLAWPRPPSAVPLGHFDAEVGRHDTFKIIHRIADLRKHAFARRFA